MSLISVVIPVFNEALCLEKLMGRLLQMSRDPSDRYEFIFVDDGSTDRSRDIIQGFAAADPNVHYVFFSRNFGHEAASTAGIDHASGDAVILIDADLQDPPELIPQMIAKWRQGYQVAYGRRRLRKGESVLKRLSSWMFYRIIRTLCEVDIPPDTGDFRLVDRCVVKHLLRCREDSRFMRGLVAWTGFRQAEVLYDRDERSGGQTKYNFFKLLVLALDAVLGFSIKPLRVGMVMGLLVMFVSMAVAGVVIVQKLVWGINIPGYPMLASGVFFLGGVQVFLIGMVGEYVGRTYRQVQQRPLYIVMEKSASLPGGPEGLAPQGQDSVS